ncbi:RES family NAD+ phosphorylase [SAR92 clade bacterium H455]|uniref:RES family NAD+ phosphorylase n=1 Tax=SAR92 clade bacterium H455 TaxID=2974818 RepID=A0ABY5TPV9_9GAMM|nr:RES family NAD+ phosphorylase [SAR92 clade bacterium H455]
MIAVDDLPMSEVNEPVYRIILSRYPQVDLFERVSNSEDWDVLYAVESLTNPRLRDEVGDIRLVPPEDRVYGDGASWIMAAFTHPPVDGRGGRFNRDFGIYYCAADESVAIAESSFHRARFLRESRIEQTTQDMRVLRAQLTSSLHDVRQLTGQRIYHPDDYGEAQQLGYALRDAKSHGVHYQSVRVQGQCYGVMRPRALSDAIHWRYLRYHYDQGAIVKVEPLDGSDRSL